ncbi:MAG: type II secretion system protein F, partial [Firmicutes bacterium]|nr:type II secretion system protein F [Bacillota bacterium]
ISDRQHLRMEVHTLTAQGRYSGWVLIAMPFLLGLALWFMSPSYMAPLFQTSLGLLMIFSAFVSLVIGGVLINRMVRPPDL